MLLLTHGFRALEKKKQLLDQLFLGKSTTRSTSAASSGLVEQEDTLLVFVRHGERSDKSDIEEERARIDNLHDCPLTHLGVSQAHLTGQYLRDFLAGEGYERVVVESSPILRTLETAAAIAQHLDIDEININYRIFEKLNPKFFPDGCPVDEMVYTRLESAEEEKAFVRERLGSPDLRLVHSRDFRDELKRAYPE